ncbi:MAG: flagellar basal body rod protein FlgB [Granulosicoccaceae bacterium]
MEAALDKALGIHDNALKLRSQRSSVIASNIANSDTPNFKARDVDFKQVLAVAAERQQPNSVQMQVTHQAHLPTHDPALGGELMYRTPTQPALDGNTVDTQAEHTRFAENTFMYQASLSFLSSKFKGISYAIKGQ